MKWLGTNKPYDQYHRDEMLEDLDKVIAYANQAVKNCNAPVVMPSLPDGLDDDSNCDQNFKLGWIACWKALTGNEA